MFSFTLILLDYMTRDHQITNKDRNIGSGLPNEPVVPIDYFDPREEYIKVISSQFNAFIPHVALLVFC